jgi:SAM-dependent methyltransferase
LAEVNAPALEVYGRALQDAAEAAPRAPALRLVDAGGQELGVFPLSRYLAEPDAGELALLARLPGPVLDVGCGPGRHVLALAARGVSALGLDLSPLAVRLARRRGADVVRGNVFGEVPRAGHWGSALLLDGNIGIGGDPPALLRRVASLLRPGGVIAVEVEVGAIVSSRDLPVRLRAGHAESDWFCWGRLGVEELDDVARCCGLDVRRRVEVGGRCYAELVTPSPARGRPTTDRAAGRRS